MRTKLENRKSASCPGTHLITTPELSVKICPECGSDVEIFSDEHQAQCGTCGTIVYQNITSCIQWCRHARECLGDDTFERMSHKKRT